MMQAILLWAGLVATNSPVTGVVENRPSDEWMVLEVLVGPDLEPRYIDYKTAAFPCSTHEGQKFQGSLRPTGQLIITKCVEA